MFEEPKETMSKQLKYDNDGSSKTITNEIEIIFLKKN